MRSMTAAIFFLSLVISSVQAESPIPANGGTNSQGDPVKNLINKLNSTSPPSEMSSAKNKLAEMGTAALPQLHEAVTNDKRIFVRVQCCFVLSKIADPSSLPVLYRAAQSPYPALNRSAVQSIRTIGGVKAVESLQKLQAVTKDTNLRIFIRTSLTNMKKQPHQTR